MPLATLKEKPQLKEKETTNNHPFMFTGWPGRGSIASIVAEYLIKTTSPALVKKIALREISPQSLVVKNGIGILHHLPDACFYYLKRGGGFCDLYFFLSPIQFGDERDYQIAKDVVAFAKAKRVSCLVSAASLVKDISVQSPVELSGVCNHLLPARQIMQDYRIKNLVSGEIHGLNGAIVGIAAQEKLPAICLLAPIPAHLATIANPKSARKVLQKFCEIVNLRINFVLLDRQILTMVNKWVKVERQMIESFKYFQKFMEDMGMRVEGTLPFMQEPFGKPEMSTTEIPPRIYQEVEQKFEEAKKDRKKIYMLKAFLDRWGLFEKYEDKFLDLFKE